MRVAIITERFGEAFGQERVLALTVKALKSDGHSVDVITAQTITPHPDCDRLLTVSGLFQMNLFTSPWKVRNVVSEILSFLGASNVDVVHFMDYPDARIIRAIQREHKTVFTAHSVAPTCPSSHRMIKPHGACEKMSGITCLRYHYRYDCLSHFKSDLRRTHAIIEFSQKKLALKNCDVAIAISRYVKHCLLRDGWDADRIQFISNPVEVGNVKPHEQRPAGFLITAASRLVALKGIDYLIHSLNLVKDTDWHLWIIGDGPMSNELTKLAGDLKLTERIKFWGALTHQQTLELVACSDLFVQPNLGPEGFGLALAEASALGKAVIGSKIPAIDEIVDIGVTGSLVETGNNKQLADAIDHMIHKKEKRAQFGQAGQRRIAELFNTQLYNDQILRCYQSITHPVS